jgi:hypothetical protein
VAPGGRGRGGSHAPRSGTPGRHRDGAWPGRGPGPRPDSGAPAGDRVRAPQGSVPLRAPVGRGSRSRRVERLGRRGAWPGEAGTGERADAGAVLRAHVRGDRRASATGPARSARIRGPGDGRLRGGGRQAIIRSGHWITCRRRRCLAPRPRTAGRTVARGPRRRSGPTSGAARTASGQGSWFDFRCQISVSTRRGVSTRPMPRCVDASDGLGGRLVGCADRQGSASVVRVGLVGRRSPVVVGAIQEIAGSGSAFEGVFVRVSAPRRFRKPMRLLRRHIRRVASDGPFGGVAWCGLLAVRGLSLS